MKEMNGKVDAERLLLPATSYQKGMKRLLLVILVMAFTITAALISTDGLGLFFAKKTSSRLYHPEKLLIKHSCDYSVGRWVKDENKTLYSGDTCKRWLSGMWACRLMPDRPDYDFENYRWQPDGCDLPAFHAHDFLLRMQNKVVAFIGDSIGRQQHQSLMCMLTGGKDHALVEDVSYLYGLVKPPGVIRADGTAQMFKETNTTIIYYWSASLCEITPLNNSDPNTEFAMHLDRPATFIQKYLESMDVLILNTGHHWNKGKMAANKWVMHVKGQKYTDERYRDMSAARNFTVHKVIAWLDEQIVSNRTKAEIFMRTLSPRHFFNGEWDSGGRCDNDLGPIENRNITGRMVTDPVAESAILGTRVHLLNVTYLSQFRNEAHLSKYRPKHTGQDCLHWCLPGLPDIWNDILYAELFFGNSAIRNVPSWNSPDRKSATKKENSSAGPWVHPSAGLLS